MSGFLEEVKSRISYIVNVSLSFVNRLVSVDYWEKYYKPDAEILERLLDLLKDISQSKGGVEGLSYRDLIKTLDNVINRCYGRK